MDKGSFVGIFVAVAGLVAGLLIEGGNLGQILQPTAALIVFGGTLGAVMLQFPLRTVVAAFRRSIHAFTPPRKEHEHLIQMLVSFANKARRNGVVSLDSDLQAIHRMSCDIGQGYFFARPMPKAEFVSSLRQRANQKMAS